jgi:dTDP-4-amino-4,6-dideoxygalactose transaminase
MTPAQDRSIRLLQAISQREHVALAGRGAAGICAALKAFGFHQRNVLLPANTCYIVLWAVLQSENYPLLLDIDAHTGAINPELLPLYDSQNIAAIIPCHMYGIPAPIRAICVWAAKNGVAVIEDAALAIGNEADEKPCGAWGDVSIFSFGLGKIVDVELGGVLLSSDERLIHEITRILNTDSVWNTNYFRQQSAWNDIYWALHHHERDQPELSTLYTSLFAIYGHLVRYQLPDDYWDDLPAALMRLQANRADRLMLMHTYEEFFQNLPIERIPSSFVAESALWRYSFFVSPEKRSDTVQQLEIISANAPTRWYPSLQRMAQALQKNVFQRPTPTADYWGASVINLPLDNTVSEKVIGQFATVLAKI